MIPTSINPLGTATLLPSHLTRLRGVGIGYERAQLLILDCGVLSSLELTMAYLGMAPGTWGNFPLLVGSSDVRGLWWVNSSELLISVTTSSATTQVPWTYLRKGTSYKLKLESSQSGVYTRTIDDSADLITDLGAFYPNERVSLGGSLLSANDKSKLDVEAIRANGYDYIPAFNTTTNRACVYDTRLRLEIYPNTGDLVALT